MEAAMQHHIGSYAPRDRLAVGSYREANDTMSAAERVPLLAADSRRIAAALEASVVDPESLVASVSGRDDGAASSSRDGRGHGRLVTAAALLALLGVAAIVGARGGGVGARLMTLGDGFQGASDGGTWGFAPAADRDGLGAGVDATAWDAGLGGGAVDTPWLGAGTFARDASDPAATPRWVQSLMPSAGERGDSVASMGDAETSIGAAAPRQAGEWSGKVQELVSALTQAVNGEAKDDDADAVAAVGAEQGDAAGADDTAVHADATAPQQRWMLPRLLRIQRQRRSRFASTCAASRQSCDRTRRRGRCARCGSWAARAVPRAGFDPETSRTATKGSSPRGPTAPT